MVKKGEEVAVEPQQPVVEAEAQAKTYTQEEHDTGREAVRQEELEKYQGIQRTIAKKDEEILKLKAEPKTDTEMKRRLDAVTAMVADLVDREDADTEVAPKRRKSEDYLKSVEIKDQERSRQDYNRKADTIFTKAKEVCDKKDLRMVELLLASGQADSAEEMVTEVESSKTEVKETKESEESRIERLADEKARQRMEDKGLNVSDAGGAASGGKGKTFTGKDIENMSAGEFKKEFPDAEAVHKAMVDGRITD